MSIQDTAYPRLKTTVTADELQQVWTPTDAEHCWVRSQARGPVAQFGLLASLKIFQRLGYFLPLVDLPKPIWDHLVQHIKPGRTRAELLGYDPSGTRWRHQRDIRAHLGVQPWDGTARHLVVTTMRQTVARREAVADLVNVTVEELVRQRRELPPFGVLWRTARRIQARHQHVLYRRVATRLSSQDRERLAALFAVVPTSHWSPWQGSRPADRPALSGGLGPSPVARILATARRYSGGHSLRPTSAMGHRSTILGCRPHAGAGRG